MCDSEGNEGVASAMAMTTERVTALGGTAVGSSIRPAAVATSGLHLNFAAQAIIALAGAATAVFLLGRVRGRPRTAGREAGDGGRTDTNGV